MKVVQPCQVASLSQERNTRRGDPRGGRRCHWLLQIGGPFCMWPRRDDRNSTERIRWQVSDLLGCDVRVVRDKKVISIFVVMSDDELDHIRQQEYKKAITLN